MMIPPPLCKGLRYETSALQEIVKDVVSLNFKPLATTSQTSIVITSIFYVFIHAKHRFRQHFRASCYDLFFRVRQLV